MKGTRTIRRTPLRPTSFERYEASRLFVNHTPITREKMSSDARKANDAAAFSRQKDMPLKMMTRSLPR